MLGRASKFTTQNLFHASLKMPPKKVKVDPAISLEMLQQYPIFFKLYSSIQHDAEETAAFISFALKTNYVELRKNALACLRELAKKSRGKRTFFFENTNDRYITTRGTPSKIWTALSIDNADFILKNIDMFKDFVDFFDWTSIIRFSILNELVKYFKHPSSSGVKLECSKINPLKHPLIFNRLCLSLFENDGELVMASFLGFALGFNDERVKKSVETFLEYYANEIKMEEINPNVDMHDYYVYRNIKDVISTYLAKYFVEDIKWAIKFDQLLDWDLLSFNGASFFTEEFVEQFKDRIVWASASSSPDLGIDIIRKYENKIDWKNLSQSFKVTLEFIEEFKNKINWSSLSENTSLSIDMIEKYNDLLDWTNLTLFSNHWDYYDKIKDSPIFNDGILWKYRDKIVWDLIGPSFYKEKMTMLSESDHVEFLRKYKTFLNWKFTSRFIGFFTTKEFEEFQDYIDIGTAVYYTKLPEWFILKNLGKLTPDNWNQISFHQTLTESFIRSFEDRVDWNSISFKQTLSESFIRDYKDRVDWSSISFRQKLSEPFIREFASRVNWSYISSLKKLSEPFIREFYDMVDWEEISQHQTLSEPFIREFIKRVHWKEISRYQKLSEPFIREFIKRVDWPNIAAYQKLSEDLIADADEYLRQYYSPFDLYRNGSIFLEHFWYCVSEYQTLSESFIRKYKDKVNWSAITRHQKMSTAFINEFKDKVDWNFISKQFNLSEAFIRRFHDKLDWPSIMQSQELPRSVMSKLKSEFYPLFPAKRKRRHYFDYEHDTIDTNKISAPVKKQPKN